MNLEIDQLIKRFGAQRAIMIEQLKLENCSTLAILGPSGGGKSTLLRMLAGLSLPDSGSITINGQKLVFEESFLRDYRKSIGIVFQSYNLFPHLTALENVVLPLVQVHAISSEEAKSRSMELLQRFELGKHGDKKPHALSGGQIQRVALIRAIAHHPQMVILDEPTSALDPLMTAEVLDLILELKKEKKDLIIVTHHLHFAKSTADQVLFVGEGKILESGSSREVFEKPKTPLAKQYMAKILTY